MLFNTIDFAVFLPLVFLIYWFVFKDNVRFQNLFLVVASYIFYGWWDYRFLGLLVFSTVVDYIVSKQMVQTNLPYIKKRWLWLSVLVNLGILGYFKYFHFFVDSFTRAFSFFGAKIQGDMLDIVLPVGISFYTFQTMSYTIDVYRKKINSSSDFISFAAYVSFFPQLVAGPIERATHLLPQFLRPRTFDNQLATKGMKQILWGLFKKMVIADNCAIYANLFFNNQDQFEGGNLLLGAFFFAFQIYGDFSGYSDIAIGTSRLFGFELMKNFDFPYFSRDLAEFWRKWHISLTTWFRDYVYIPLGGNRSTSTNTIKNILLVFIISGLWHGANWTFVIWGLLNALFFIPLVIFHKNKQNLDVVSNQSMFPNLKELRQMASTFGLVILLWIVFRSENITQAIDIYSKVFSKSVFHFSDFQNQSMALITVGLIIFFMVLEWFGRRDDFAIDHIFDHSPAFIRFSYYAFIICIIGLYSNTNGSPFIYFQF